MNLILHIGQPKTGTTSIQNILQINKKILQEFGFLYDTNMLNHQPIFQMIKEDLNPNKKLLEFVENQKKLAKEKKCHSIIISSETLFEEDKSFLNNLVKLFELNIKVIVYLKRQDLYLESIWKQWHFKNKHYKDFNDFSKKFKLPDYYNVLKKWEDIVKKENIVVIPFEKKNFNDGLLKHFLITIGVPNNKISSINFVIPKTMFGTNQGLSSKGLEFAFLVRDFAKSPLDYKIENFIHEYLDDVFHKDFFASYGLFNIAERKTYIHQWIKTNQKIALKYLKREIFFEEEVIEDEITSGIEIEDVAKVVMALGMNMKDKLDSLEKAIKDVQND